MITGLALVAAPFVMHVAGVAGGATVLTGFAAVLGSYLVLWRDAVVRVRDRLNSSTLSQSTQEWIVTAVYMIISAATIAVVMIVVAIGRGG
jgi:hypothetical protein